MDWYWIMTANGLLTANGMDHILQKNFAAAFCQTEAID